MIKVMTKEEIKEFRKKLEWCVKFSAKNTKKQLKDWGRGYEQGRWSAFKDSLDCLNAYTTEGFPYDKRTEK